MRCVFPGLPKRNPALELANAFSVIYLRCCSSPSDKSLGYYQPSAGAVTRPSKGTRVHPCLKTQEFLKGFAIKVLLADKSGFRSALAAEKPQFCWRF
jgi:hypothetical protein